MHVEIEVPRFGQFARRHASIQSRDISACLDLHLRHGDRIGDWLVREGHLNPEQVTQILKHQARWSAQIRSHDISPNRFPLSTPVSVCMPCYNEQEVIGEVLAGACAVLPEFLDEFELIVVDDGSLDETAAIVEQYSKRDQRVRLERHDGNRGYGAAVTTGLRAARGEWICITDGDGQFNLLDLPQLLVAAHSADVVIGYRYRRADRFIRRFNAQCWNGLIRFLLGVNVRDLDCAFKIFPRWVVEQLALTTTGPCISTEIVAQCVRGGLSVCEVPVNHYPRCAGNATGNAPRVVARAFRELPIVWKYRRMSPWDVSRLRAAHSCVNLQANKHSTRPGHRSQNGEARPASVYVTADARRNGS